MVVTSSMSCAFLFRLSVFCRIFYTSALLSIGLRSRVSAYALSSVGRKDGLPRVDEILNRNLKSNPVCRMHLYPYDMCVDVHVTASNDGVPFAHP